MSSLALAPSPMIASDYDESAFIDQIKTAALTRDPVLAVKASLESAIRNHPGFLSSRFHRPTQGSYARRLLYADPAAAFSVVVMTWGPGQGTLLHDHGGIWVVECVYSGRMKVTNFDYLGEVKGLHQFAPGPTDHATPGEADYRHPPEEYHVIENGQDQPSITIHVFGGNLEKCHTFEPVPGGYVKVAKRMELTKD